MAFCLMSSGQASVSKFTFFYFDFILLHMFFAFCDLHVLALCLHISFIDSTNVATNSLLYNKISLAFHVFSLCSNNKQWQRMVFVADAYISVL